MQQTKIHDAESTLFASAVRKLGAHDFKDIEFDIGGKKSRRKYIRATERGGGACVIWVKSAHTWPGRAELLQFTWKKYQNSEVGAGHKAIYYSCESAKARGATHLLALVGDAESGTLHMAQLFTLEEISDIAFQQQLLLGASFFKAHPASLILQSYTPDFDDAAQLSNSTGIDILGAPANAAKLEEGPERVVRRGRAYQRDPKVRDAVLRIANGICECCGDPGFVMDDGTPYLETHHIIEIASRGPDSPDNVVAVCPMCHRKAHYSAERRLIERRMIEAIRQRRREDA